MCYWSDRQASDSLVGIGGTYAGRSDSFSKDLIDWRESKPEHIHDLSPEQRKSFPTSACRRLYPKGVEPYICPHASEQAVGTVLPGFSLQMGCAARFSALNGPKFKLTCDGVAGEALR
jgi:hypothetical protein